ncbi:MAG: aminoacyl-tRNA hydrolase [Rhodospirillaceae bacterium]
MRLLVGLGNPGAAYSHNRHNIGFMALDAIAERYRFSAWRSRFQGMTAEGAVGGTKVLALKPMTYMNLSGQSVGEATRFFKIVPEDVVVIYDEIELVPGKVRVKQGGGSAGHNGIRSIDAHIGQEYWRVRLGVGRPAGAGDVSGHVLQNFGKADLDWLGRFLDAVAEAAPLMVAGEDNKFMTKVALLTAPPAEKDKTQAGEQEAE